MTKSPFPYAGGICMVLLCLFATAIPCSGTWMEIRVGGGGAATVSPAELLITDPLGHRTGYDPSSRTIVRELPAGVGEYGRERMDDDVTGEVGPESVQLSLSSPEEGLYRLTVIGVQRGDFWLDFDYYDTSGKFAHKLIRGHIDQGRIYRYRVEYSQEHADKTLIVPDTYRFRFLPPFQAEAVSVVRAGNTVPIRFRLTDRDGKPAPGVKAAISLQKEEGKRPSEEPTEGGWGISYTPKTDLYCYMLSTKRLSPGKWEIIIHLEDGSEHTTFLEVR